LFILAVESSRPDLTDLKKFTSAQTNFNRMKTILTIITCFLSLTLVAQSGTTKSTPATTPKKVATCYDEWYAAFKDRGAKDIADGTHEVIISLRNEYGYAECFFGKIDVKDGKIASKLQVQKVDGSYEDFYKKVSTIYQNADGTLREEMRGVSNGMSETLQLSDGEKIRLFFYKSLSEKAKANKKAPSPSALIKN
jgi:hypothetical protein